MPSVIALRIICTLVQSGFTLRSESFLRGSGSECKGLLRIINATQNSDHDDHFILRSVSDSKQRLMFQDLWYHELSFIKIDSGCIIRNVWSTAQDYDLYTALQSKIPQARCRYQSSHRQHYRGKPANHSLRAWAVMWSGTEVTELLTYIWPVCIQV